MALSFYHMNRDIAYPLPKILHLIIENMCFHDEDDCWFVLPNQVFNMPFGFVTTGSPYVPGEKGNVKKILKTIHKTQR